MVGVGPVERPIHMLEVILPVGLIFLKEKHIMVVLTSVTPTATAVE